MSAVTVHRPLKGRVSITTGNAAEPWRDWIFTTGLRTFWRKEPGRVEVTRTGIAAAVVATIQSQGSVRLLLDGRMTMACTASCQRSTGPVCDCSCCGRNHGVADAWRVDFGVQRPDVEVLGPVAPGVVRGSVVLESVASAVALLGSQALTAAMAVAA
jgi:hypothetical protein